MYSYVEDEGVTTSDDSSNEDIDTVGDNLQEDEYHDGIWLDDEIFARHHYIQDQDYEEADTFDSLSEFENIVNLEFSSEEEAGVFFNSYAKLKGFGMRKDKVRRMKRKGSIYFRTFLCYRAGYREEKYLNAEERIREERPETRCGCQVRFSVKLDRKTSKWYVHDFHDVHNHELTYREEVCTLWSHRAIDGVMTDGIEALEMAGLRKNGIMRVMQLINGGYQNVGHIKKDLYNHSARRKKARVLNGDAERVLQWMRSRREVDRDFYFDFDTDKDGRLTALFWSDAQSRIDYECFGDVLVFDSTYCVNRYNMSLVPFVGVNHHRSTVIFGCGIVANECWESYQWLLTTFMRAMSQKFPKTVITDGCPSMAKAIRTVLKDKTHHRLCTWHIELNMKRYLHRSGLERFRSMLYHSRDPIDFENKWADCFGDINMNEAEDETEIKSKKVEWLKKMYESKERWAAGFLRGKLLLGMKTNQRSESINSVLQAHLDRKMYLFQLVVHYERCLMNTRQNEIELDCRSSQSTPVLKSKFKLLEKSAATIFTQKVFYLIQKEIKNIENYQIAEVVDFGEFKKCVLELKGRGKRTIVECYVGNEQEIKKVECECMKLDCDLIPCRHIMAALVEMGVTAIPQCCIRARWTKRPKLRLPLPSTDILFDWSKESERNRVLTQLASHIFHEASMSEEGFTTMIELLQQAKLRLKDVQSRKVRGEEDENGESSIDSFGVADPKISVRRGAPKKVKNFMDTKGYKCSQCHKIGHNKATCPKNNHD